MSVYGLIRVLGAAFLMGLAAAAPVGPVNIMAIRRGVVGGWRHTLACGIGSLLGDMVLFSLALIGGSYFLPRLSNPKVHAAFQAVGAVVLLPVGAYFLALAVRHPHLAFSRAYRRWSEGPLPRLLVAEAAKGAVLTVCNPLSVLYWAAVSPSWLTFASPTLGARTALGGVLAVGLGLAMWFAALTVSVRFVPQHSNAILFRSANAILGLVLLGVGSYCAILLSCYGRQ